MDTVLYCPFRKLNKPILYINVVSNHPKYVLEGIVKAISIRVLNLLANKDIFNKHAPVYNSALMWSIFKIVIQFILNAYFKNGLANLSPDAEVTDYPRSMGPSFYHRSRTYSENILVYNQNNQDRNGVHISSSASRTSWQRKWEVICYAPLKIHNIPEDFFKILERNFPKRHKYQSVTVHWLRSP